jgi:dipeptidyl aminopeptidase/acylaminoacyl peptidase
MTTSAHGDIAARIVGNIVQASAVSVSPDGTSVAFVVSRTDLTENIYVTQIWLAPTDASAPARPITQGPHDGSPSWLPDGSALVFVSRRSATKGQSTIHVIPVNGPGELRSVATMPDSVATPRVSPDGKWIGFTARTPHERYSAKGAETGDFSWQAPRKIDRFFTQLDNEGWVYDRPEHVYVVPTAGTAAPRNLTPGEHQHTGVSWAADSQSLITAAQRHPTWDLDFSASLYRVGLDGSVAEVTAVGGVHAWPSVSADGSHVAFIGFDDSGTFPQNSHVGVVPTSGGRHRWVTTAIDRTFDTTAGTRDPVWTDEGTLIVTAEDRGQTHLYRVSSATGAVTPVTTGAITVKSHHSAGGTTCATIGSVDGLADVYTLGADGSRVALTSFADDYRALVAPQGWERFTVPCGDGSGEIDAWIMRPADFDPVNRYPVLLNVHGGPHTQYGETFFDEAQMQAAAGFVVLMCNPRGGSGREESWGQAIMGPKHPQRPGTGWGSVDVDDVLAVLDAALSRYEFCDAGRVGMLGGSYGGYMATWLAAHHPHRFRGICTERAVNNLYTEEFTSDISTNFRVEHGPIHLDDPDEYMRLSPIIFVDRIDVPVLIIHSENDLRCPISQAEELFVALRLRGKDVTFYRFPGESHELSRSGSPVHRRMRAEIILDWFAERTG